MEGAIGGALEPASIGTQEGAEPLGRFWLFRTKAEWTPERIELLRRLHADGMSYREIAAEMGDGFTRNSISGKVFRLKLPIRPKPKRPIEPKKERRATVPRKPWGLLPARDIPAEEIPLEQRKTFSELRQHHCRFMYGLPQDADHFYCGADKELGFSWCAKHCRMVFK